VFITLKPTGPDRPCIQVSKEEVVSVDNETGTTVAVTLGARALGHLQNGFGAGFGGSVGDFVPLGLNKMTVSTYSPSEYPEIWVTN
jgi:hypothetical protein